MHFCLTLGGLVDDPYQEFMVQEHKVHKDIFWQGLAQYFSLLGCWRNDPYVAGGQGAPAVAPSAYCILLHHCTLVLFVEA